MDFVANALCLDFANTVNKRPDSERDNLAVEDGLAMWAQAAGLKAEISPGQSEPGTGVDMSSLREAVYRTFSAVSSSVDPPEPAVADIMSCYRDGLSGVRLRAEGSRYALHRPPPRSEREILWAVAASAVELLTRGPLDRIGECPSCGWLFLDTSRNGQRRWCSMATCGSRSKARHYSAKQRRRAAAP